jgi:accessory gene regulator protein AgrB
MVINKKHFIQKYVKKSEKTVKKLEAKPILNWGKGEWLLVCSILMVFFSLLTKGVSVSYWMSGNADMSTYSDYTVICFLVSSILFIIVPYLQKNIPYLFLGIVGLIYTSIIIFFKYVYIAQPVV